MGKYIDIIKIRDKYNNGEYRCVRPLLRSFAPNHIFDENLSVRRNREMVEEHNRNVEAQMREYREKDAALHRQLREDVVGYIWNEYDLNEKQARAVEWFAYDKGHSSMYDYFSYVDEFADFAEDIVNAKMDGKGEGE